MAKEIEYTVGNGQCNSCGGSHPLFGWGTPGHSKNCPLAEVLRAHPNYKDTIIYAHNNKHMYRVPGGVNAMGRKAVDRMSDEEYFSALVKGY